MRAGLRRTGRRADMDSGGRERTQWETGKGDVNERAKSLPNDLSSVEGTGSGKSEGESTQQLVSRERRGDQVWAGPDR